MADLVAVLARQTRATGTSNWLLVPQLRRHQALSIVRIGRLSIGISLFIANAKLESRCKALTTNLSAGLAPTLSARPRKPRSDRGDLA